MEKSQEKTIKKLTSRMQARLLLVFCVVTLCFVGLMGRLIYLIQTDGERYAKQVLSRQSYVSAVLPYKRGEILDRNGTVLARSELQYRMNIDPKRLLANEEQLNTTLAALKEHFAIEEDTILKILEAKPESRYQTIQKNLKYDVIKSFETIMEENPSIHGVWFEQEYMRNYPYNTLASDILGFTSADNLGYWGIEEYYNKELNGTNGREYGYYDADLNIERIVKKAVNGNSVVSTIDINAQRIIQEHIIAFNTEFGSKNIGVLVMDPNTGEVLAMATNQEYDLNKPRSLDGVYSEEDLAAMTDEEKTIALNTLWKNDAISFGFEPGSTFKPVTIAAALEEGLVSEDTIFYCDGVEIINGEKIHCSKRSGHGELTLGEALMVSCNDALMQIAAMEGREIFHDYQKSLGFGRKTGIDLPGEEAGITMSVDKLNNVELAVNSFGQTFNATMIQMAAAYSSLVNGGYYYEPHVVKRIINENGATVKEMDKVLVRQTVSEETSEFLQKYLYQTVEAGTAKGAQVEGYAIGGKTGTGQKYPREAKTYLVSFLGSVPAINPEIVIYVMIDEPQNVVKQADSAIATKFASRIMVELLPALGIYPEGEIDYLLPDNEDNTTDPTNGGNALPGNGGAESLNGNSTSTENGSDHQGTAPQSTENTQNSQNGQENQEPAVGQGTENLENGQEPDTNQGNQSSEDTQNGQPGDGESSNQPPEDTEITPEDEFNPDALD